MLKPYDTHQPELLSWVDSANLSDTDFPIQNLPFGRFKTSQTKQWRIGVAIGDQVFDLKEAGLIDHSDMTQLLALGKADRLSLREHISKALNISHIQNRALYEAALLPMSSVELGMPFDIGDYTDFYIGIHHATNVGKLFRPDQPLLPNYKWVPVGYHGRASTVNVSGTPLVRPRGQIKTEHSDQPSLQPSRKLDFELEMGVVIGQGNAQGVPITIAHAEEHLFGLTLFNDWSARDIQSWEYQPLGPFLSKSFASTLSPWIVTLEALEPFRKAFRRPANDPSPLEYLSSDENSTRGSFDIQLEVLLQTSSMKAHALPFERISCTNFDDAAYWSLAQLITHHTVNGCSLRPGDLLGTGTLSGPRPDQAASLLELTRGGSHSITLSNGETRTFLQDGDSVAIKGWCQAPGCKRIGFGECVGQVLPSLN